jgi:hypothetical protein
MACIMYGRELGLGPMTSLKHVRVINGEPSLSAQVMRARIFEAGHLITIREWTDDKCVLEGVRQGSTQGAVVAWTVQDGRRAGLFKAGGAWEKYPRAMLLARATSELARAVFPDCLGPAAYTPEELGGDE